MAKRGKKRVFSKVKAVKANARERVGQPKPERVIDGEARGAKEGRGQKHPPTLQEMIERGE